MQISTVYLSALTFAFTSIVIGNAFYKKKQFYPSVVYITKSNISMAVIYIQFFVVVFIFGKLLRKVFLGTLRSTEFEHLLERFWYALTETCLAFTVFRDDFNPRFVALFTVLLFLKSFHWLAEERVDFSGNVIVWLSFSGTPTFENKTRHPLGNSRNNYQMMIRDLDEKQDHYAVVMERSPVLGWLFHVRVLSLLVVLGCMDYYLLLHAYNSTIVRGPTVQLVFGFEYGILLTVIASIGIKYLLHAAEMQTENPWENKAVFLLYTELIIGLIKVLLYVLFVVIMAKIYALPMFVFRPMFFTMRSFKKALSDVIMSRRAIRNMNTLYPDATPEELRLSDNICIICREDMVANSKKLPCGHIFHTSCLRSWFQRQQTCPTCRLNILRNNNVNVAPSREEAAVLNNAANDPTTRSGNDESSQNMGAPSVNIPGVGIQIPQTSVIFPNPIPFLAHYSVPPPIMPRNLSSLTDEELRILEGTERRNIEERLKLLGNIRLLIDASTVLMNQYAMVSAYSTETTNPTTLVPPSSNISEKEATNITQSATDENVSTNDEPDSCNDLITSANDNIETQAKVDASDVTVEDIGQEEDLNHSADNASDINLTELSELRKRRLKYLHESTQM